MSTFPFISISNNFNTINSNELPMYYEIAWDFNKNEPILSNGDFKIIEGIDAIKVWVFKEINTVRYQFQIYSWDYGCEINELIGQKYTKALTQSEAERYIKECIIINPYIIDVKVTHIDFDKDLLSANIKINTIYGEDELNV